jgi:alpha-ribazole phosphatase
MRFIDFIRHGEPVGGGRYRGQSDDPLSERGWKQMWATVGDRAPWRRIVTSPLLRCSAFAYALGERHGLAVTEEPDFKEVGFGVWEGRRPQELEQEEPGILTRFYADPVTRRPDGAEPLAAFAGRVIGAWQQLVRDGAPGNTLVVAHAGTIRAVLMDILGMPLSHLYRITVPNAGLTRIRIGADRPPTLLVHGRTLSDEADSGLEHEKL